ncbi:MAG: hypothetical protein HQL29_05145 [Candidatus Omnitrophica bacterium]|nr:hypothetical protein [Candidatus Omnitrophota bacterium]
MKISEKNAKEIYKLTKAVKDEKEFISKLAANSLIANTEIEEAEAIIQELSRVDNFTISEGNDSIVRGSEVAKIIIGFKALQELLASFKNEAIEPKEEEVIKK